VLEKRGKGEEKEGGPDYGGEKKKRGNKKENGFFSTATTACLFSLHAYTARCRLKGGGGKGIGGKGEGGEGGERGVLMGRG